LHGNLFAGKDNGMRLRWVRVGIVLVALVIAVGVLGWFFMVVLPAWATNADAGRVPVAQWISEKDNVRGRCLTLISVLTGLVVAAFGVRRYSAEKEQQRLDRDKHLTGVFDSAAGRLESADPTVRAAALRTLFRLMVDSPRDHMLVVNTFTDVLRQRAPRPTEVESETFLRLPPDVVAALDGLRDRPDREEPRPIDLVGIRVPGADLRQVRLAGAVLGEEDADRGADLTGADLRGADLSTILWRRGELAGADLRDAALVNADLTEANLSRTRLAGGRAANVCLAGAILYDADLTGVDLRGANLRRARFRGARLDGTDLTEANLTGADLAGTDLSRVVGFTNDALREALVDSETTLPTGLRHPRLRPPRVSSQ
jgi:uncharacterized protein YjbI with pentapeptide repeats